MSTLMNDDVRGVTTPPGPTDDRESQDDAHWDATVNGNLGDTVPMDIID